jgi:hypothetical protein
MKLLSRPRLRFEKCTILKLRDEDSRREMNTPAAFHTIDFSKCSIYLFFHVWVNDHHQVGRATAASAPSTSAMPSMISPLVLQQLAAVNPQVVFVCSLSSQKRVDRIIHLLYPYASCFVQFFSLAKKSEEIIVELIFCSLFFILFIDLFVVVVVGCTVGAIACDAASPVCGQRGGDEAANPSLDDWWEAHGQSAARGKYEHFRQQSTPAADATAQS